jgi:hypothetical protein
VEEEWKQRVNWNNAETMCGLSTARSDQEGVWAEMAEDRAADVKQTPPVADLPRSRENDPLEGTHPFFRELMQSRWFKPLKPADRCNDNSVSNYTVEDIGEKPQ